MLKKYFIAGCITLLLISCAGKTTKKEVVEDNLSEKNSLYLLAGTYTAKGSEGIYVYKLDTVSGNSELISTTKVADPSYLTLTNDEKFVYAVTESNDLKIDAAHAYSFDKKNGKLIHINTELTNGAAPCYISVDKLGKHVITANYMGGSISIFDVDDKGALLPTKKIKKFEGKGGPVKDRQEQAHLHCVYFSPDGKYLLANDLGNDRIYSVDFKSTNQDLGRTPILAQVVKAGSGPRHTIFHPNHKWAYLITEISGDVIAFNNESGKMKEFQTIKIDSLNAQGSGDIQMTPDGKFVYASNRLKGDGVAVLSINQENGELTQVDYTDTGIHPRNMAITPNGSHLLVACRDSDAIQIYKIDRESGKLTNINKDIKMSMPVCLKFASLK